MEVELGTHQEYRLEVSDSKKIKVMVIAGLAEVRGQELLNDKWYTFSNIKTAIFTFTGAKLKIDGACDLQYIAVASMFPKVFSYFDQLKSSPENKRIVVLGNGRSTFCATLANYFVRMHQKVIFTEIDPAKGNIFPGALSTMVVDTLVDYQENFKLNNPVCLFYGSTEIDNPDLYDLQIGALVNVVESKGLPYFHMILAPEMNAENINSLIKQFSVHEVVFVGNERLYHAMDLVVDKLFIENSGYILENTIARRISNYFNGINSEYTPCTFLVKQDWNVVRVGEEHAAPESALPLGAARKVGKTGINKTEPIEGHVLAISEAEQEEDVATGAVVGFIVCVDEKKFRVLCTQPRLPKLSYLIQGSIKYVDY